MILKGLLKKQIKRIHLIWLGPLALVLWMAVARLVAGPDMWFEAYYDVLYHLRRSEPMEQAVSNGDLGKLKELLDANPDLVNARAEGGTTPLHWVMGRTNDIALMKLLLKYRAPVNANDWNHFTPLHEAACENRLEAAKLLLAEGADWRLRDRQGRAPLDWAAIRSHKEVARLLLAQGAELDIFTATLFDEREQVSKLLKVNPNLVNSHHRGYYGTPLCESAAKGLKEMTELLIKNGADVNPKNASPLIEASSEGYYEVVKLLLENGADVNARDSFQRTALYLAVGRKRSMELLVAHGADVNAKDNGGLSPLHRAADSSGFVLGQFPGPVNAYLFPPPRAGFVDEGWQPITEIDPFEPGVNSIKLLLDHHADPNSKDTSGQTPLHHCAASGSMEAAELLVAAGAEINARDKARCTPLGCALKAKNHRNADWLRKHGAVE